MRAWITTRHLDPEVGQLLTCTDIARIRVLIDSVARWRNDVDVLVVEHVDALGLSEQSEELKQYR